MGLGRFVNSLIIAGSLALPGCVTSRSLEKIPMVEVSEEKAEDIDFSDLNWIEAIIKVKNPPQAAKYISSHLHYDHGIDRKYIPPFFMLGEKAPSFKYLHQIRGGVCYDYALASAALLFDDGYPPLILDIALKDGKEKFDTHSVFLFNTREGYSYIGYDVGRKHDNLYNLAKEAIGKLVGGGVPISYCIRDLRDNSTSYINGEGNQESPKFRLWRKFKKK